MKNLHMIPHKNNDKNVAEMGHKNISLRHFFDKFKTN